MRNSILLAVMAFLVLTPSLMHAQRPEVLPGDLLVMLKPDGSPEKVASDLAYLNGMANGLHVERLVSLPMRTWLLRFDPQRADQAVLLRAVRNHPHVQLAQNNHQLEMRSIPNDDRYADQWHHQNINSEGAWDISTGGVTADGDTIVVCIIENCNLPHADLIGNAWFNHQEIPGNGIDDDANGYIDDYRGWDANAEDDDVYGGGHGTQVAGMIGATGDNGIGVVGASWSVKMMVVTNTGASDEGVIASHSYPLTMRRLYNETNGEKGAFVVATNASWGINGGQPADAPLWCAMYDSLGAEGVLNCGATANNAVNVDVVGDLPTACPSDFMISVTATDIDDERTFSAYGITTIDVGAPGDNVLTTNISGGYGTTSGTSFASPLTAGVIGLLYSAPCSGMMTLVKGDPQAGALFVRQKLFDGVDQVGNLPGNTVTGGRINAGTSMQLIMATCGPCPAPYNVAVQAVDITSAVISWEAVSGSLFDLRYRQVGAMDWVEVPELSVTDYLLEGLDGCTPYEFQVLVHCEELVSDYSNTYTWTSEGCCTVPVGLTQGFVGDDIVNVSWNELLAAGSYSIRYAPSTSSEFIEVTDLADPFFAITPLDPCTNYSVQVLATCEGTVTEWSAPITVGTSGCGACTDLEYCATEGGDSSGEWLDRVQVGSIDNTSGNDGGYGDHTDNTTELVIGSDHAIVLTPGFSSFTFSEWYKVWIDLDQNGVFATSSEVVFASQAGSNSAVNGTLSIPATTVPGPTRMRIAMRYNAALNDPCAASFNYGEVEDYCVNMVLNTGLSEGSDALGSGVLVYPQPADERLWLRSNEPIEWLRVLDGTGRILREVRTVRQLVEIGTADLADGVYLYQLSGPNGQLAQGRFLVTHAR